MKANHPEETCPFKTGDIVVYRPSRRGHALGVMIKPQLERGRKYGIARIDAEVSIVVEGFENHHAGGIYWTEFSAK
jgi:hypothetical protein